jgi:hypothetical protein
MKVQDWLTLGGLAAAIATLIFGLVQYRNAQEWKRAEFVAGVIKEFESQPFRICTCATCS